jgi:hypothetical protein
VRYIGIGVGLGANVLTRHALGKHKVLVGDLDPQDPHVLGPPGSGSISQRYGPRIRIPHQNVTDPPTLPLRKCDVFLL